VPIRPFFQRLERDNVLAVGENHAADRHLVHLPDGLPDHREGVVTDLAVGTQVVGTDQIARVDVGLVDELVDLDGPRRLQRQLLEFLLGDLDVLSFVEFVALDYVLVRDLVTGIGVDLHVLDPMPGLPIELIERDLLRLRGGGIKRHRAGDQGQSQEAFPIGARGHARRTPVGPGFKTNGGRQFRHSACRSPQFMQNAAGGAGEMRCGRLTANKAGT
jgi:hypothetical protein